MKIRAHFGLMMLALIISLIHSPQVKASSDEWRFELTPYLWLTSADIDDATVKGQNASAELDFGDIWDMLDFAVFARFEAWKGNWGFIFDGYYVALGAEGELVPRLGPVTFPTISTEVDFRQTNMDFALSYRFSMPSENRKPMGWIDPIVGVRIAHLDLEMDISKAPGPVIGALGSTIDGDQWYVEPFVGGRIGLKLTEALSFAVRGDIGGFDIGEASHLAWNLVAGFDYKPWQATSIKLGYRIYDINWDDGDESDEFGLNGQLHGPVLGVTFHF